MKRLPFEEVSDYFKAEGCQLLEKYYINNRYKMKYRCKCGNISKIIFADFKSGKRCKKCANTNLANIKKNSIEYVKAFFENHSCELLDHEYKNNHTKVSYVCKCGRLSEITFSSFKRGSRCKECGRDKNRGCGNPRWKEDKSQSLLNNKLRTRYKKALKRSLEYLGIKKNEKTEILLGYSSSDLAKRIYGHPNWNRVKDGKWHIDHIFPVKAFLDYGIIDIKLVNALDNLQPLSEQENLAKWHKYNRESFLDWLQEKGVICPHLR